MAIFDDPYFVGGIFFRLYIGGSVWYIYDIFFRFNRTYDMGTRLDFALTAVNIFVDIAFLLWNQKCVGHDVRVVFVWRRIRGPAFVKDIDTRGADYDTFEWNVLYNIFYAKNIHRQNVVDFL